MEDFDSMYRANAARVLALSRKYMGVLPDAEDMMQEIFFKLWQGGPAYDSTRGDRATWFRMIVRNRAIDELRRTQRRQNALQRWESEAPEAEVDADEGCFEQESIQAAIAKLPDRQQEVVRLAYFEERSHSEIALLTSTPLGTVKTRLRLALERLSGALAEAFATPPHGEDR